MYVETHKVMVFSILSSLMVSISSFVLFSNGNFAIPYCRSNFLEVPSSFFNLLNDDVVDDIDQEPLRDYENDMDEGNGEKGDDEEVEEIDERVFDASQPTQCKRIMNYIDVKGACLVQVWESVSLDAMADNDQTRQRYWQRI
jgi:hypothetical protein